ncbi:M20/M25/M40 family metallo-hydrolase [Nitrococcus mobilis]|uniref:Peptidase M28 n=1 Tax=Nitrococcus mobilis Nb-231 TaxID=314278 RepID=A4BSP3_9GAMM|nr:M20/M25/M40 family metallo-hydrolase [Nitrococcus mobilis]EAR21313.1 Peptidase M28 [Nitrococcus mobilis Nb-231]
MLWHKTLHFLTIGLILLLLTGAAVAGVHHKLHITLKPDGHRLEAVDTVTLPEHHSTPVTFRLHTGLDPRIQEPDVQLRRLGHKGLTEKYAIEIDASVRRFTVAYQGEIFHPVASASEEYARSFSGSAGVIGPDGVFLPGASFWYPQLGDDLVTFSLTVTLPPGWRSVSQGVRTQPAASDAGRAREELWSIEHPQEEIYLIAGAFTEYRAQDGEVAAMAFLREPDAALARKYLAATARYIEMYRRLIGAYPYRKFALVENFWETGYGMPSFTLLGPRVIRLPFILRSSYPHEILHNWWGNGVYVDYATGNWAEGLTSYLADHLLKAQQGQGAAYRRETLQKYTDYVREDRDFPLTEFRARHSSASEAVGYGKAMMLFHMLREQLGDAAFIEVLRKFYHQHLFQVASFEDWAATFSRVSGQPLHAFFEQWVARTGAPLLRVYDARVVPVGDGYRLTATVEQIQPGAAYRLELPVTVYLAGRDAAYQTRLAMAEKTLRLTLRLPARPLRLDVDPQFDLFRRLHRDEIPPALSQIFGAERVLIVLSAETPQAVQKGYAALARAWQRERGEQLQVTTDAALSELPTDRAIWLFGWENRFRPALDQALKQAVFSAAAERVQIAGSELERARHSIVVVARQRQNPAHALAWLAADNVAALPGLARKLPHYGRYSYLGFTGSAPENVIKGRWPVVSSPMSIPLGGAHGPLKARLAPRKPLAELPPLFKPRRMMRDISYLADPDMAGRGLGTPALDRAARYIAEQLQAAGLKPAGEDGSYYQTWTSRVTGLGRRVALRNVVARFPGTHPERPAVIVGAHYDHLGRGWPDVHRGDEGKVHPGADDNASGIAVMLELARTLGPAWHPARTVEFVAFTGEEAGQLGSTHYMEHLAENPASRPMAMINLDTVGRLGTDKLLVLATGSAREWPPLFRGAGFVSGVPIKIVARDIGSSDQTPFLKAGIPAVQLFTGAHGDYHRPTDTVDKIDSAGLSGITAALKEVVEHLANRTEPLHSERLAATAQATRATLGTRRPVQLGCVPDFAWAGQGVRLSGVTPDTPAEAAGLRAGDVIIRLDGATIDTLADFAKILRRFAPGQSLVIELLRDGKPRTVTARVVAR